MQYREQSDKTLVMLTLAGEQNAYEELVVRHQRVVLGSALAVTRRQFLAEDAAQDAFVTAWMKLNTLKEPEKFGAWVCRIARNCALNIVTRFREYLPLEVVENLQTADSHAGNPAELLLLSEERGEVQQSVEGLPEKVRQIIRLHYFEGLSIAEIADKMRISPGTVKWQLHDGRKRIRKELCAMNEKLNDTLVQRVMKKVEELKNWQVKKDKSGFEKVYQDVLREVEELPESVTKDHALADVLMRGWWRLPGEKNDALFARIVAAAESGKNEEVMAVITRREDMRVAEAERIEFIRKKQIPRLEKAGFVRALGEEWYWLGLEYHRQDQAAERDAAFEKMRGLLSAEHSYSILAPYIRNMGHAKGWGWQEATGRRYWFCARVDELRYLGGKPCYWSSENYEDSTMISRYFENFFYNASCCDGNFFADIAVGERVIGSDGASLTFVSASETVETPAGVFTDCRLWESVQYAYDGKYTYRNYYKEGVGLVQQEQLRGALTYRYVLSAYHIAGGEGLLPLAKGNTWEYDTGWKPDVMRAKLGVRVDYADGEKVMISSMEEFERLRYDEDSWADMMQQVRQEYWVIQGGQSFLCDVGSAIGRAKLLAKTPMEKAHTKAAASVIRRIMDTNARFHPNGSATGLWNFFGKNAVWEKKGAYLFRRDNLWSFEWKSDVEGAAVPLLFNDVYGILMDAANALWSDEWRVGASKVVEYDHVDWVRTEICCVDGGTVETKAGTFKDCMKLILNTAGMTGGLTYRGGEKRYYFAEGVGIVRTENLYAGGAKTAVYELTAYEGTGEGYMPLRDGLFRRYEAVGLTDGYVGAAEYTYAVDADGELYIFSDRTGIRNRLPAVTSYRAIWGEAEEERLWNEGRHDESRLRFEINNFHLLAHFLERPCRYWAAPVKAAAWNEYRLKVIEHITFDGEIPQAWYASYAMTALRAGCALCGCDRAEEGYAYLEKAFDYAARWKAIPKGARLEVGDPLIYGGIRLVKGEGWLELPDGSKEPHSYEQELDSSPVDLIYYAFTAPNGWEWFDSVRGEERYREFVERARMLME